MEEVIVLVCGIGNSASKRISGNSDGSPAIKGFNAGAFFSVLRKQVNGIAELSALLRALEEVPSAFVIRGAPVEGLAAVSARRNLRNFATPKLGRRWLLIDLDKIPLPDGLDVRLDAQAVAEHLVRLLPAEFHQVSYHYQASSSAGLRNDGTASMHLWFWLSEPQTDKALKRWGKAVNQASGRKLVDTALFNGVQAHYVAAPVFEGMADPLPQRSGFVAKASDSVRLQLPDEEAPRESGGGETTTRPPSLGFATLLERIGDHPDGEGFHEPIIRAIASYVAMHGRESTDIEWLYEAVRERVLSTNRSQHDARYVEHMASREHIVPAINGALKKFGNANPRRKARVIPGMDPHFGTAAGGDDDSGDGAGTAQSAAADLHQALRSIVRTVS